MDTWCAFFLLGWVLLRNWRQTTGGCRCARNRAGVNLRCAAGSGSTVLQHAVQFCWICFSHTCSVAGTALAAYIMDTLAAWQCHCFYVDMLWTCWTCWGDVQQSMCGTGELLPCWACCVSNPRAQQQCFRFSQQQIAFLLLHALQLCLLSYLLSLFTTADCFPAAACSSTLLALLLALLCPHTCRRHAGGGATGSSATSCILMCTH